MALSNAALKQENYNALKDLTAFLQDDMDAVLTLINQEIKNEISLIPRLSGHLLSTGGKCIRPLLTIAAAKLCHYQGSLHRLSAACIELIHMATLLHDDVVDESHLRRGSPSANSLWGNQASILVGDFLFSRAFTLMMQTKSIKIIETLSHASATIAEGEIMQLMDQGNLNIFEPHYIKMVQAKTAALFEASTEIGALLAEADIKKQQALQGFGRNFGICFQIIDDVLDYCADQYQLGKNVGHDFQEGKVTLPVIYAFQQGTTEEKKFWHQAFQNPTHLSEDDLGKAKNILLNHNALEKAMQTARKYAAAACANLDVFEDSPLKSKLTAIITFCLNRC